MEVYCFFLFIEYQHLVNVNIIGRQCGPSMSADVSRLYQWQWVAFVWGSANLGPFSVIYVAYTRVLDEILWSFLTKCATCRTTTNTPSQNVAYMSLSLPESMANTSHIYIFTFRFPQFHIPGAILFVKFPNNVPKFHNTTNKTFINKLKEVDFITIVIANLLMVYNHDVRDKDGVSC